MAGLGLAKQKERHLAEKHKQLQGAAIQQLEQSIMAEKHWQLQGELARIPKPELSELLSQARLVSLAKSHLEKSLLCWQV